MKTEIEISWLLVEYRELKAKLEKQKQENRHLSWPIASHIRKLESIQNNYNRLRLEYNRHNPNSLKIELETLVREKEKIEQHTSSTNRALKLLRITHRIERLLCFTQMKKSGNILPLIK